MKNATVTININLYNSTKEYNFWSPLTNLVEECKKEDVNPTLPSKIVNGKGSIKFILPNPLPQYANTNNKQAAKWRRQIRNRQLQQLISDEAMVFKTEDKRRAHANKNKTEVVCLDLKEETTTIKEIVFDMWYEECMIMSQSRDDDGTTMAPRASLKLEQHQELRQRKQRRH